MPVSLWQRIAALVGIFIVALVGAAFATDALTEDEVAIVTTATQPVSNDAITVLRPVWVDTRPNPDDPVPVPESIELGAPELETGLLVVQPPSEDQTQGPPDSAGPVEVAEIEAVAAAATTEQEDTGEPETGEPETLHLPGAFTLRNPIRERFIDPCARLADGACPLGIGAVIRLGELQNDFSLIAETFHGEDGRFRGDGADLCPSSFIAAEYNFRILAPLPTAIEFAFGRVNPDSEFETVTIAEPQPGNPEYDRWVANRDSDNVDEADASTWFRTCVVLDVEPDAIYNFVPVIARTGDGRVAQLEWVPHLDTRPPAGSLGRPPVEVVPGGGSDVSVYVWSRGIENGYRTVAWPIDMTQPDPPSCAEIESELFFLRWWGMEHPDLDSSVFAILPIQEISPPQQYDGQWGWRQRFDLQLREGRRYTLCTWEAFLGDQSFDNWEVLEREQLEIVTPNQHPIVMSIVEVGIRGADTTHDVAVSTNPAPYCDPRAGPRNGYTGGTIAYIDRVHEGTQLVRVIFCESRGLNPDPTAFIEVYIDGDNAEVLAISLHPDRGCELGGIDPACSTPFAEYFDASVEVPDSCASTCTFVDLRIKVDYLASMGGGTDHWQVGEVGSFENPIPTEGPGPAVDTFSLDLAPIPGRVDALMASFTLNGPAEFEIRAAPGSADPLCLGNGVGSGSDRIEVVIDGLCPDTAYVLTEIIMTDGEGNTREQSLHGSVALTWTNGIASHLSAQVQLVAVNESAAIEYCQYLAGIWTEGVSERCWETLRVHGWSRLSLGNSPAIAADPVVCLGVIPSAYGAYAPALENQHIQVAVHGQPVSIDIYVMLHLDPNCGHPGSSLDPHSVIDLDFEVSLQELDDQHRLRVEKDGLTWEIRLGRTDRGIANRFP